MLTAQVGREVGSQAERDMSHTPLQAGLIRRVVVARRFHRRARVAPTPKLANASGVGKRRLDTIPPLYSNVPRRAMAAHRGTSHW